jgi:hypothetical protein
MITFLTSMVFILPFLIVAGIVMIISLETNKEGVASTFFSLATALVIWSYGSEIWELITQNILTTVYFSVGYVILGLIWSFLKWNQKVAKIFKLFSSLKAKFIKENGEITASTKDKIGTRQKFYNTLSYKFKYSSGHSISSFDDSKDLDYVIETITPKGIDNKAKIVSWISYWPLSLIGTLLNDPFRRFFEWVYESVSGVYDKITKRLQNKYIQ